MKEFTLDEKYITSVTIRTDYNQFKDRTELSPDEFIAAIKAHGHAHSISSADHPKFAELRNQLGEMKYITIQRGWWNGDEVLKKFTLNGKTFKKGDKFPCGAAMGSHLKYKK